MQGYGQFCSVARAHEALGGRWTLLIVRELLCGGRRFNTIRRGIPRISRTMLSERLQALINLGAVVRQDGAAGPEYALTAAGEALAGLVTAMGVWGQRWLPRLMDDDVDLEPLLADMERRVRVGALPSEPLVVRFDIAGHPARFMLIKSGDVSCCRENPGFPEPLRLRAPLGVLVAWWRGDLSFLEARRQGLALEGPRALIQAFPGWFDRYPFASIRPATRAIARRIA
ncbi:MAG TPA: helix-turn-helix domain-containing protein [Caulobacteraceae bacterium]|nr:helix-turn-helix domain-containing protein [Caulobacteraceae bacterium]